MADDGAIFVLRFLIFLVAILCLSSAALQKERKVRYSNRQSLCLHVLSLKNDIYCEKCFALTRLSVAVHCQRFLVISKMIRLNDHV